MSSSAPRCRLAIVRTEPPPLVAAIRQLYAGRSPLHPPPLQKADVGGLAPPSVEGQLLRVGQGHAGDYTAAGGGVV